MTLKNADDPAAPHSPQPHINVRLLLLTAAARDGHRVSEKSVKDALSASDERSSGMVRALQGLLERLEDVGRLCVVSLVLPVRRSTTFCWTQKARQTKRWDVPRASSAQEEEEEEDNRLVRAYHEILLPPNPTPKRVLPGTA